MMGHPSKAEFDLASLSINWKGGPNAYYFGPHCHYAMFDARPNELGHEGTHLWMQRAMGPLFPGSWTYNAISAVTTGFDWYYGNWYEEAAYLHPFTGGPNGGYQSQPYVR